MKFQGGFLVVFLNILNLDIYLSLAYILSVNKCFSIEVSLCLCGEVPEDLLNI